MAKIFRYILVLGFFAMVSASLQGRTCPSACPKSTAETVSVARPNTALETSIDSVAEVQLQWPESMTAGIGELLQDPLFERSQVGLVVYDLDGDSVLFEHNGRQLMRPASVTKILTSCTALNNLGGEHRFRTQLHYNGEVCDSTLHGDIYIKGGFDPLFNADDMTAFIQSIKSRGINNLAGNIYADVSFKDTLKWGEGWCWDDKEETLTPLLYEGKNIFMQRFMEGLTAEGIIHPDSFVKQRAIGDSLVLLCERNHTVNQMLARMMKDSDNLFAESLFYQLGASDNMPYASAKNSAEKEYALIRNIGLCPDDYTIADGSGLSLYNYFTPDMVVRILRFVWQHNDIFKDFYPSLPISGVDGTLKKRMKNSPAYGKIHAKTGTLRKVSTLAGYTMAANGTNLAFCIFNQGLMKSVDGRNFQDNVCNLLVK